MLRTGLFASAVALLTAAPASAQQRYDCYDLASVVTEILPLAQSTVADCARDVPEMSAGAAVAAVALLAGVASIVREKSRRK